MFMVSGVKSRVATLEGLERRQLMSAGPLDPGEGSAPGQPPVSAAVPVASSFVAERGANHWFSRVTYNGHTYIDEARSWSTHPWFRVISTDLSGNNRSETTQYNPTSQTWDAATRTLVQNFPVGRVTYQYTDGENSIGWRVTVENNTTDRIIQGYNILITDVRFTSPNINYPGQRYVSGMSGGVPMARVNDGDNAVFLVNDNPGTMHMMNFQQYAGSEQVGSYRVRVGTARLWGDGATYPTNDPVIVLQPGQSDHFAVSVRFASAALTSEQANPDLFEQARERMPFRMNWNDRRPIGAFWAHGGNHRLAQIDTSTPAGVAEYQQVAIQTAHQIVSAAQAEGLQGVVFWDLEGTDQFRNPVPYAYAGDPRMIPVLNPAFDAVADQFFAILRAGGLKFGFTIRNSDLTPSGGSFVNAYPSDPAGSYTSKVTYAKQRWGAELFYVDVADIHDVSALHNAYQAHPDVLLMPETRPGMAVGYNSFSVPFLDQRFSGWNTPAHVREVYADAFSVVWVGDTVSRHTPAGVELMREAVRNGDILMAHVGNMMDVANVARTAGVDLIRPVVPPPPVTTPGGNQEPSSPSTQPDGTGGADAGGTGTTSPTGSSGTGYTGYTGAGSTGTTQSPGTADPTGTMDPTGPDYTGTGSTTSSGTPATATSATGTSGSGTSLTGTFTGTLPTSPYPAGTQTGGLGGSGGTASAGAGSPTQGTSPAGSGVQPGSGSAGATTGVVDALPQASGGATSSAGGSGGVGSGGVGSGPAGAGTGTSAAGTSGTGSMWGEAGRPGNSTGEAVGAGGGGQEDPLPPIPHVLPPMPDVLPPAPGLDGLEILPPAPRPEAEREAVPGVPSRVRTPVRAGLTPGLWGAARSGLTGRGPEVRPVRGGGVSSGAGSEGLRPVSRPARPAAMGPKLDLGRQPGGWRPGVPVSMLRDWRMAERTVRVAPAVPAPVTVAPAPVHVAPLITGVVRVNPLAIANAPSLFSSSALDQAAEGEREAA